MITGATIHLRPMFHMYVPCIKALPKLRCLKQKIPKSLLLSLGVQHTAYGNCQQLMQFAEIFSLPLFQTFYHVQLDNLKQNKWRNKNY